MRAFLTAEWRYLAMLNYRVNARLLEPYVPLGTELDRWQGHHYLSVVGFLFQRTRVLGVAVPFHVNFEEVNLRFYVRREVGGEVRRAVTFIREIVPRVAIATLARLAYDEPYLARPMRHTIEMPAQGEIPDLVSYGWRSARGWSGLEVTPEGVAQPLAPGTEEEFITEHFWGYTRRRDGATIEYRVEHPPWRVWSVRQARMYGTLADVYGPALSEVLRERPHSAFLADGSAISVGMPRRVSERRDGSGLDSA